MNYFNYILILLFSISIYSESNSNYRFDDSLYSSFGKRNLSFKNRANSIPEENKFINLYLQNRFYSQRGGNPSNLGREYGNQSQISPEFSFKTDSKIQYSIVFSPRVNYSEKYSEGRSRKTRLETELIFGIEFTRGENLFQIQTGRSFQRFDSYGIFFNNFSNFIETKYINEKFGFSISLNSFEFNKKNNSIFQNKIGINPKLFGFQFLFQKIPAIESLNLFYFQLHEPFQNAEKRSLEEDINFSPKGKFHHSAIELKTNNFLKYYNFELGGFHVQGVRSYKEYQTQKENRITSNANLFYLSSNFEFSDFKLKLGGLSIPVKNKNTNEENGYPSMMNDSRIYGGKSSFLLQENISKQKGEPFSEFDSSYKNNFNHKGMILFNLSLYSLVYKNLHFTFIINQAKVNDLYKGYETILLLGYNIDSKFYFSSSIARARVDFLNTDKSFNEFQLESKQGEFWRFYISSSLRF